MEIADFDGHRHFGHLLARWHAAEFGRLYDLDAWNEAIARDEFRAMRSGTSLPVTLLAFAGAGRTERDLLGSVSLLASDDLAGFERLAPWIASLYVVPAARGRGVGDALLRAAVAVARAGGHERVHLFTAGQEEYYRRRGWRVLARTAANGHPASVMARTTSPATARRAVSSHWSSDPDVGGAYSYVRAGSTPAARDVLGGPILPGLWLAGEATWRAHPGTMHGAWFSGERAAEQALAGSPASVIVVGAGLAGIAAARVLRASGVKAAVLERTTVPGGRAATDRSLGVPLHLGAAWIHGDRGHPLAGLVASVDDPWDDVATVVAGGPRPAASDEAAAATALTDFRARCAAATVGASVAEVLALTEAAARLRPAALTLLRQHVTAEYENLYAAPLHDVSARHGAEPYVLPGRNRLMTSALDEAIAALAGGLDVRFGHHVASLARSGGAWHTDGRLSADAVIVTVPVGALRAGRLRFEPPLPPAVRAAIDGLGAGPVCKLFTTYDERWWTFRRAVRIAGASSFVLAVDASDAAGTPTLCWFAVGSEARRIEAMTEDEQCELAGRAAAGLGEPVGLTVDVERPAMPRSRQSGEHHGEVGGQR